jgi:folate-binding protein YgfZ
LPIFLPPPQLLEIAGTDAAMFAHAQFSSDVNALADGQWQWSAWLSAQGRVRAFFHLLRSDSTRLTLILRGGSASTLRTALAPYVLRSKVQMRVPEASCALGFRDPAGTLQRVGTLPAGPAFVENDGAIGLAMPGDETRWYVVTPATADTAADDSPDAIERWRASDIAAGVVDLDDALRDRYLPAWIGLDRLGAVSVRKGCYPGQEIVARLHFKGGNKRWLHRIDFTADALPPIGTTLDTGAGTQGGELLNAAWTSPLRGTALAVLPKLPGGTVLGAAALPGAVFRVVSAVDHAND